MNNSQTNEALHEACDKIAIGFLIRYGDSVFSSMYDQRSAFCKSMVVVMERCGLGVEDALMLGNWLSQGLRPFSEFPPRIEALLQMAQLVNTYPITPSQEALRMAWYAIDLSYGQTYRRLWRSAAPMDDLGRERVWLSAFESVQANSQEIKVAVDQIHNSGLFRQYPPTLEQFLDAIIAVRNNAPIVEVAWLEATNTQGNGLHPLIIQARAIVGSHDLKVHARDKDMEYRFKKVYRDLLIGAVERFEPVVEQVVRDEASYESKETLAAKLANW